jgi:hypothetical protein
MCVMKPQLLDNQEFSLRVTDLNLGTARLYISFVGGGLLYTVLSVLYNVHSVYLSYCMVVSVSRDQSCKVCTA